MGYYATKREKTLAVLSLYSVPALVIFVAVIAYSLAFHDAASLETKLAAGKALRGEARYRAVQCVRGGRDGR